MKIDFFTAAMILIAGSRGAFGADTLCAKIVGLLATDFAYHIPNSQLARVEIRQCAPDKSETLQLVAWRSGHASPALVVNTDDFGVVQAVARVNVFVVETGGATRDQVFAILYEGGEPRLALKRKTRGTARVTTSASAIDLIIEGIYAGDAPARTESQHFALDPEGTKAQ